MIDDLSQFLEKARTLPPDKHTAVMTMFVFWSVAQCVYYIVLGVVVIVLGRRMINAALTAWREIRREPS
jgi:predicted permease